MAHGSESRLTQRKNLLLVLSMIIGFMVIEVVGSVITGGLALLADAGHMLTDGAGLTLSLLALWFATKPPTPANTYGYVCLEILAALANGVLLFSMAAFIQLESARSPLITITPTSERAS